ncbi:MAG: hypothetical protein AAGK22_18655, partial [Acidobacteriota bacterium]
MSELVERLRDTFAQIDFGAMSSVSVDPTSFDPRVWLAVAGLVLLLFGRRLYALALGAAGFTFGWSLAPLLDAGPQLQLGAGVLLGVIAAMLAFFVQKMLLSVAGFVLGLFVSWWLVSAGAVHLGGLEVVLVVLSGFLGAFLMRALFGATLVVLSSFVGASLLVEAAGFAGPVALASWLGAALLGILLQTRSRG